LENLKEKNKFLDTFDHPKLNQEDINHLNRSIIHNEIEATIMSLPKEKVQDLTDSVQNSTRPLKKELIPILLKLFNEIEREGTLPIIL
jgi:NADH/NAD ratio-sensing transcriptional regulator Rex